MTGAPDSISQYIDALCAHLADFQDRVEASKAFTMTTEDDLRIRIEMNGEICGMRRALAIALGFDPEQENDKEEAADTYYREWRERHGR
jgi:hypothetical protein